MNFPALLMFASFSFLFGFFGCIALYAMGAPLPIAVVTPPVLVVLYARALQKAALW